MFRLLFKRVSKAIIIPNIYFLLIEYSVRKLLSELLSLVKTKKRQNFGGKFKDSQLEG
jgi:hypothetical protein